MYKVVCVHYQVSEVHCCNHKFYPASQKCSCGVCPHRPLLETVGHHPLHNKILILVSKFCCEEDDDLQSLEEASKFCCEVDDYLQSLEESYVSIPAEHVISRVDSESSM